MKNRKTTTYILAISAVLIWALVAVQVVRWTRPEKETAYPVKSAPHPSAPRTAETIKMDYSDPFLKELGRNHPKTTENRPSERPPAEGEVGPPPITYKGLMCCSEMKMAIVMENGMSVMLRKGDPILGFTVQEFSHDELVLLKKGKKYILKVN